MLNTTSTYNLKVVLKETGLAADTLRAWERRYGLPTPQRSAGGHRLYSQRDIETIKWLIARQEEGLSISRAVDLWKEKIASGADPLADSVKPKLTPPSADTLEAVRREWISACMSFNEALAEQTLNQAFALYPLETVCTQVLQLGLREIGEMWYRDEVIVQQEHFASALAHRKLDSLIAAAPPPTRPQTLLIGCTPGERHFFSPQLLTLFMRRRGFPVVFLGEDVPLARFDETLQQVKPALVILSAQQLHTAGQLYIVAQHLSQSLIQVAYGGRIFNIRPELRQRIPAHFLGETIEDALQSIELLLSSPVPDSKAKAPSKHDAELATQFKFNRSMIDVYATTEASKMGFPLEYLYISIQHLDDNLESAILLGSLEALKFELDWVRGLMQQHQVDQSLLSPFLAMYAGSVKKAMGQFGQEIFDWLMKLANE